MAEPKQRSSLLEPMLPRITNPLTEPEQAEPDAEPTTGTVASRTVLHNGTVVEQYV